MSHGGQLLNLVEIISGAVTQGEQPSAAEFLQSLGFARAWQLFILVLFPFYIRAKLFLLPQTTRLKFQSSLRPQNHTEFSV